jgi:hypothetical protein
MLCFSEFCCPFDIVVEQGRCTRNENIKDGMQIYFIKDKLKKRSRDSAVGI